jgi:hypothetical protein
MDESLEVEEYKERKKSTTTTSNVTEAPRWLRVARASVAFAVWMTLNIVLSFSNKYLFVYKRFVFPLLIIILGTLATFVGCGLLLLLGVDEFQWRLCLVHWKPLLGLAIIHGVDVGLENFSIVFISISLNQIIKATVPAMTLGLTWWLDDKHYTPQLVLSTGLTVVGAIMAVLDNPEVKEDGVFGLIAACLSAVASAISTLLLGILLQRARINALTIACVSSVPSALVLLPPFLLYELPHLQAYTARNMNQNDWLALVAVLACLYNLSRLYLIKFTAAHYSVVAGNVKVALIVILSMAVFGDHGGFSPQNWAGTILAILGFTSYTYFKFRGTAE